MERLKFTKLPDLLDSHAYLQLVREDAGYSLIDLAEALGYQSDKPLSTWEKTGSCRENNYLRWCQELYEMLFTRRAAIDRHIKRMEKQFPISPREVK